MKSLLEKFAERTDLRQSDNYQVAMKQIGWDTVGSAGKHLFLRRLGPFSIGKIQRPSKIDLKSLHLLRKKYHIITCYVEPGLKQEDLVIPHSLPSEPFAQSATSIIDLTLTENELLKSFKPKTRYNIGLVARKKILTIHTIKLSELTPTDLANFMCLRSAWSKRKHNVGYDEKFMGSIINAFRDHGWIHFAEINGLAEATLLVLEHHHCSVYYSAFSSLKGYSHFAPTILTWKAIQIAKKSGCDIFDFGGIYDPRYSKLYKKWRGFSTFKEGFSATTITYPPTRLLLGW